MRNAMLSGWMLDMSSSISTTTATPLARSSPDQNVAASWRDRLHDDDVGVLRDACLDDALPARDPVVVLHLQR